MTTLLLVITTYLVLPVCILLVLYILDFGIFHSIKPYHQTKALQSILVGFKSLKQLPHQILTNYNVRFIT